MIDWEDIILHCIGAVMLAIFAEGLGGSLLTWFLVNLEIWLGRELWQHRPDFHEVITRRQPLLEWVVPSVLFPIWWLL